MLELPQVTLICLTSKNLEPHEYAIKESCEKIKFGSVKMIVDYSIDTIDKWNKAIIYDLYKYVDTEYALLIHADGYVISPELWNPDWLNYDYIGAPWPLPQDDFSYRDEVGDLIRVGNSVSLRSVKLMKLVATREWKPYFGNTNEDGFISVHHRKWAESQGCKFAPLDVAIHFSKEHDIPENKGLDTFCFHSL